ncbi:MAG TPA: glycine zipper domain-containing protein [Gemmatimonadales bacterium]|nr:glycine zipper domain-containing protein [Gemmatimonadales bacterium]
MPETGATPGAEAIPAGAELHAALVDSIHSRRDTAGQIVTARLMENVTGRDGRTLLPAGSTVQLTVVRIAPAGSRNAADGRLELRVDSITAGGMPLKVAAQVSPVPHELRGRGVTGSEAAKVGAGAAAGAIAGRVLGGDTRGAVIGGVVGAAGGAAVAHQTADRDVVVKAGTPFTFVLTEPLVAPRSTAGAP